MTVAPGPARMAPLHGGPVRALVTVIGLDQHEAGSLAVARLLRDAAPRSSTPALPATRDDRDHRRRGDVDVVGSARHSWEFLSYAPELVERLGAADPPIPIAVGGSIITTDDREQRTRQGSTRRCRRPLPRPRSSTPFRRLAASAGL